MDWQPIVIGPSRILRTVNETNVFIPCPYSGRHNPVWIINSVEYELFNVPHPYEPTPYGLLIPLISKEMNGTTFQCLVSSHDILSSSVGTIIVHTMSHKST